MYTTLKDNVRTLSVPQQRSLQRFSVASPAPVAPAWWDSLRAVAGVLLARPAREKTEPGAGHRRPGGAFCQVRMGMPDVGDRLRIPAWDAHGRASVIVGQRLTVRLAAGCLPHAGDFTVVDVDGRDLVVRPA